MSREKKAGPQKKITVWADNGVRVVSFVLPMAKRSKSLEV